MDNDQTGFHEWHKSQSSKVMFIDSNDATAVHNGTMHFTYVFRDTIMIEMDEGILVSLLQASVPYSFYNVRDGINDKIDCRISQHTTPSYTPITIQMPAGNYTAISMANKFVELLQAQMQTAGLPATVTMTYDRDAQKFKFTAGRDDIHCLRMRQTENEHSPRRQALCYAYY